MIHDSGGKSYKDLHLVLNDPSIPDKQREVLILYWVNGMSQREIAVKLGIPLGTCKARLTRGLEKLKRVALMPGVLVRG
jgi:RNA polymerase sigma factor (sigma-70 family)